jgi:DUF4097 and DUF4098 domain-containing protein YvlB
VQKVPGQVRIDLGDLRANNVAGPVHLAAHSRSRDVQITDFTESADISTDRGSIELRPARGASGRINARIKNGDIDIALPNEARFTLSATTSRGEIQNEFGAPLRLSSEGRGASLAGSVGQGPSVTLSTDRGSITVRKAGAEQAKGTPPPPPAPPAAPGKLPAQVERQ